MTPGYNNAPKVNIHRNFSEKLLEEDCQMHKQSCERSICSALLQHVSAAFFYEYSAASGGHEGCMHSRHKVRKIRSGCIEMLTCTMNWNASIALALLLTTDRM